MKRASYATCMHVDLFASGTSRFVPFCLLMVWSKRSEVEAVHFHDGKDKANLLRCYAEGLASGAGSVPCVYSDGHWRRSLD